MIAFKRQRDSWRSCLNHHFFDPVTRFVGDARDVGGTCGVYFARTCCKIQHFTGPAEIELHPCLNHHFFEHPISQENAAKYDILGNLCSPCMSVCMHFFEHHRGSHPGMSIPVNKYKSSGGVGGGGSPPHDVMMVEELMIQLGVQPPHDVRRIDDSTSGATN